MYDNYTTMLWVLHTRSLIHHRAWKSNTLVFTLPHDKCTMNYFIKGCLQQCHCMLYFIFVVHAALESGATNCFLKGCLQVSVHAEVHTCVFLPVHLNSNRLVTAVTSTCCS